jgi:hypothetical protein
MITLIPMIMPEFGIYAAKIPNKGDLSRGGHASLIDDQHVSMIERGEISRPLHSQRTFRL